MRSLVSKWYSLGFLGFSGRRMREGWTINIWDPLFSFSQSSAVFPCSILCIVFILETPIQVSTGSDDPLGSQPGGARMSRAVTTFPEAQPLLGPLPPPREILAGPWLAKDVCGSKDSSCAGRRSRLRALTVLLTSTWENAGTAEMSASSRE